MQKNKLSKIFAIGGMGLPDCLNGSGCGIEDIPNFIVAIANFLFSLAGSVALFYFVWGGFKIVISRGNPAAQKEAQGTIENAFYGLVIMFTSYMIVNFVLKQLTGCGLSEWGAAGGCRSLQ